MVQHCEREHNLSILNKTPTAIDGPKLLHELVRRSSDSSAIEFLEHGKKRRFSYQRLHALSDSLAKRITNLTAPLEHASPIIPILLPQCPELYIVLLAVLKAGKAFCPLNLDIPDERLSFILSDISADLLITNTSFADQAHSVPSMQTICVDLELLDDQINDTAVLPCVVSTDLAYVLYTSGSTGLPKAVSISHYAVTQSLLAHDSHIPDFARFLQFAAPTFDVSIFEIFFPWFRGRTLVGCPRTQMLEDLPGAIQTLEADAAELTPTVVANLLRGRASVPGLKLLLTIGEMLTQHVVTEFGDSATRKGILWAMYGPTEAAIHCTLQAQFCASSPVGNIGYPLETVATFILAPAGPTPGDTSVKILPWGEEGELALGGHQIANEYLNRPELTAAAFVDHPHYGRLYRTGDRARFCDNGTIECRGRMVAGQVKLRGQRVELGEIEQIVLKVEGCRMAVVTVINDVLVAFCATGAQTVSRAEVLRVCKQWLPAFMIPSDVILVPSMPQLPSGKVDKRSLETIYSNFLQNHDSAALEPDNHAECVIVRHVRDCLGLKISLNSNLAAAGLDSLRAIRVASRLREEGYDLSAVNVLASQTLQELVAACNRALPLNGHLPVQSRLPTQDFDSSILGSSIKETDIDYISPCTPLQEAMLAETLSRPAAYCNWIELELDVKRTYDEIWTAVAHLTRENDILRSGFCSSTGGLQSFLQVTWKEIHKTQVEYTPSFQRSFRMDTAQALLRPFRIQIQDHGLDRQRILVQLHHALYDGWSFDLLLTDLDKLLRGLGPTKRPQFQDVSRYCIEQQQTLASEDDVTYWKDLLHDHVPTTFVNYNGRQKPMASLQSYRGRSSVNLQHLMERARDLSVNPQVFFQAATAYVLGLYTGSPDVVFGNVTSGRTIPVTGIEDVIGPCIASLPCRLNFEAFSNVYEALQQTQKLNREGLRHCSVPLREIARAASVRPGTHLFEVLFVWQQSSTSDQSALLAARIVDSADDLEFKLTLEFEPSDGYVAFRATFDSSTIPEEQILYLSNQIDEVAQKFLADTDCAMVEVGRCFTSSSLSIANLEYRRSSESTGLTHAVETWARLSPDQVAIVFGHVLDGVMQVKSTTTYLELNIRANQLAHLLRQHNVRQDQLVCIMMEKSVNLYIAILAVAKLGAGYLPLVPETPIRRVDAILREAEVVACISDSACVQPLRKSFSGTVIELCSTDLSTFSCDNPDINYDGSHVAYAVFTSGSTGTPKGVLVTQKNLMSNLEFLSGMYPASTKSRMLQSCSQAFDVSVFEIFYAWHMGMSLCTATKEDLFRDFEASINILGATHLSLTPTVAALVNPDNVPKVELLVTAGEALTEHVRRQWAGRGYGPSETTNICTVRPSVTTTDMINNIGPPFDNTSAFVLDPHSDKILPRGAIGELCFGGEQVFRGYLNRPELNAAKLINLEPYGRIYRSGDMGRLLPNDCILSAGRSDDQVKIRGQRVELGEITSIVLDNTAVADCVSLLLSAEKGIGTLVTFWVPKHQQHGDFATLDTEPTRPAALQIFDTLSRKVPTYMVPSYLVPISNIPMTAQAKIDKRLLHTAFQRLSDTDLTQCAPLHATNGTTNGTTDVRINGAPKALSGWEQRIAEVLAHILQINPGMIQRTSSFFNLGLDSVSAIRLCLGLRQSDLGDFTVAEVLKNPSISLLNTLRLDRTASLKSYKAPAENLRTVFAEEQISQIHSMFSKSGLQAEKINPCTPLQEAMLASSASSKIAYSNTMIFNVRGDISLLQTCWEHAYTRHEILRTSFVSSDHPRFSFAQVVLRRFALQWRHIETLKDVQSDMDSIIMDLLATHKPPICLALYEAESSTKLIFSCHHALYDGIAVSVLLREIQQAYHQQTLPPTISYDGYLQHMISQDSAEAETFWSRRFDGFEPTYFPDLTSSMDQCSGVLKSVHCDLRVPLTTIRAASQRASVSVLAIVQSAWAKILHYYTGENDLCFGNVVSGRTLPEDGLDQLVAPCFNTLPVRARFNFSEKNLSLVQLLHEFNVDSLAHQLTALRRIQSIVLKEGGRLFDTLLILQQSSEPLDETIWTLEKDLGEMDLPLVCELHQVEQDNLLKLTLHYNTSLLSDEDAHILSRTFDSNLSVLTEYSDAPADDSVGIPHSLRAESNMGPRHLPSKFGLLQEAFEQNASSSSPDALALDFLHADGQRTSWTYQRLDLIANHIAWRLLHQGVGIEDIVPIHIAKSPMFYACILGVLKAGAAFAPIDPGLPEVRKEFMLMELTPKVLLCTELTCSVPIEISAVVLDVTDLEKAVLKPCNKPPLEYLTGSNLAYCLYTSGSTGVPKAVSMEHRSPIQTVESSKLLVPWNLSSRLLQYAAITFDMCYYDCFIAWTFGFTLCASEQQNMFNRLSHVINSLDVTLLDLTPSVAGTLSRVEVPSVQWLYCIGEPMSSDVVKQWNGICVNSYGPTEAAFCTTMFPLTQDVKTSIIGQPYPSTSFAVFSAHGKQPLPIFSVGELYIGGAQLARGYYGRPDLTNERFVIRCGQRFYKSGDMVRMLGDGNFEFIGRIDDQVKIRGLRVELGEINQVLRNCDGCIKTVVTQILKKNAGAKEQLVSFIATAGSLEGSKKSSLQMKAIQAAKSQLPAYMVPQFCILVDRIPQSTAGKVDKKALAEMFRVATTNGTSDGMKSDHKWTDVELRIRHVFSRLSDTPMDDIYPETSIYQLGLDSISAVQIAAALRKQDYEVDASDIMRYTNCVDLGKQLEKQSRVAKLRCNSFDFGAFDKKHRVTVLEDCGLDDQSVEAVRPCTPLQQGMISQFIAKNGSVYFNYLRLEVRSPEFDVARLKTAWAKTMIRHPILRTGFAGIKDEQYPFAMIRYALEAAILPWSDGSDTDPQLAADRLGRLQREALTHLHRPMWDLRVVADDKNTFIDLSIFHGLFDAHSLGLVFDDVVSIYNNKSLKETPPLDSVLSELLQLNQNHNEKTDTFWSDLGKRTVPSRFPIMTPLRNESAPPAMLTRHSSLSAAEINEGCRLANATLQAVGIASWSSVLSAYTGERTVTVGVVLSGRTSETANEAVIPCITTVPFPCTVNADKVETLRSVMELNANLHKHQFVPLSRIQRLMGVPNESMFDSLFAYQKSSRRSLQIVPWTILEERATTEYPISIELELMQDVLEYRLTYLPHIVPAEQAGLILSQLDHVMRSYIVKNNNSLSAVVFDQSLYSITPAKQPTLPSKVQLLHEFVEFTANMHPDRVAFEFASSIHNEQFVSKTWTYHELDAEGNKIANLLLSHDVEQGGLVGVCFEKCPEASFAMLGILKAGCAFVAIDPSAPGARQAFIIEDSKVQLVLSMSAQSVKFQESTNVPVLNLDRMRISDCPATRPQLRRAIDPQESSYCLYTSGTTGTPKGCELTHENAVQAMLSFQQLFAGHWNEGSRWLQFASFHFDVSVLEQYWSWSVGICVVSAPRDLIFEDIANSIHTLNITHIDLTPSLAQILHPDDVPSLRKGVFITGGESLKQEILDVWGPESVIYNGYGPTEATIGCTMYPRVPANGKPSNIGPQFDNVGSYVLEPGSDVPVLRGGVGELCVSGKLVGKGYLNRPELTKDRFAYLDRFRERVYRTGDLVRILHDGTFDFLGRADDQVKLRGQRLEIGEINSVIRQASKEITDVATLVLKHPKQQKEQLVAFVVIGIKSPREPKVLLVEAPNLRGAKEACHDKLPPYMVPTHFVPLASMPLNINNKADGKQLKQIYELLSSSDLQQLSATWSDSQDAWSSQENSLRHIIADALNISVGAIGKTSSFYELGMDSISVIGVSRAMKQAGFSQATPAVLLKHATISQLARVFFTSNAPSDNSDPLITARQAIRATQHSYRYVVARSLDVESHNIEAVAPCTPLQQGMIARYLDSDDGLYFNEFKLKIHHDSDVSRLRSAWNEVFKNTQVLRTAFVHTDDGYLQAVRQEAPLPWIEHRVDCASICNTMQHLRQKWLIANRVEFTRPFELHLIGPTGDQVLVIHIFHGLYDGNSIEIVFEKVLKTYYGEIEADDAPSFHEALPYGPLRITEGAQEFWENHLVDLTIRPLPPLTQTPTQSTIVTTRILDSMPAYDAIRRKLNVTAQAIAQTCWLHALQEFAQTPLTTGLVVSGRSLDLEDASSVVGPLFNTIPYQHQYEVGDTWASSIARAHDFNTAALPYQHTPLRDIMKWTKRSPDRPLFDTLFVYQVTQNTIEPWKENAVWTLMDENTTADYPLAFEIEQSDHDRFLITLVTQGQISDSQSANELLDLFEGALKSALMDPSAKLESSIKPSDSVPGIVAERVPIPNGLGGTTTFDWTENATVIRNEIADLAEAKAIEISESTNIFELGLDSIDAIKLSSRLKKRGIDLPVSAIMRLLTIKGMVNNMQATQASSVRSQDNSAFSDHKHNLWRSVKSGATDMSKVDDVLPLTPLQEAMVAEMTSSDYSRYYNFDVAELSADTDIDRLHDAWHTVIRSTPILRTAFLEIDDPKIDGSYAQVVMKQETSDHFVKRLQCATVNKPNFSSFFDESRRAAVLSKASVPPFNITFMETSACSYQVFSIAHALYDGCSLHLLHKAVNEAYHGQYIPPPSYEGTLSEILAGSGAEAAKFWKEYLSGVRPSLLPRREPTAMERKAVYRKERASDMALPEIAEFAKTSKVSLQTLGQTVFALTLASYVGSLDVAFGCVLSGRDDDLKSQLIFPTMNTVPIRAILHGSRQNMLHYVQENFLNIRQWQHYPLRKALALTEAPGRLFDSLFIYQKTVGQESSVGKKLYQSIDGQSDVEYPLCVEMEFVNNTLIWRAAAKSEVMDYEGVQTLLDRLNQILQSIIQSPASQVIESTPYGTSVCSLPAFQLASKHDLESMAAINRSSPIVNASLSEKASKIRKVLASVARIAEEEIEPGMSIFHIGLDSISAIKVSSTLRKQGITLSVGEMLKAGTVEKMTAIAEEKMLPGLKSKFHSGTVVIGEALREMNQDEVLSREGLKASQVDRLLPLTAGQWYMLAMWLKTKGTNFYPEFIYNICGSLSLQALEESWQSLVAANPILRTRIVATGQSDLPYAQIVLKEASVSLTDITGQDEKIATCTIDDIATQQPWVHLFVSRKASGWTIKLKIHHALYDGVSLPLLKQQLQCLCNGATPSAPEYTFDEYLTVAHTASAPSQRKVFWTQYLKGIEPYINTKLNAAFNSKTEIFQPNILQTSNLEIIARQHGVSIQAIFLAAYAKFYAVRLARAEDDVVIGIYLANRSLSSDNMATATIPTVNLVPLRILSPLSTSVLSVAIQIQRDLQTIGEEVNATTSLFDINEWTGVKVDTFVNFLSLPSTDDEESGDPDAKVKITPKAGWQDAVSRVTELDHVDWEAFKHLENEHVSDAYLHAIDVEATVRGGKLDVGVFAPTEMLSLEDGEKLVDNLRLELEGLTT